MNSTLNQTVFRQMDEMFSTVENRTVALSAMLSISVFLGIPGVLGNMLVMLLIACSSKLRNANYAIIFSFSTICVLSLMSRPFCVTAAIVFQDVEIPKPIDIVTLWMVFVAREHLILIAVNRYFCVVKFQSFKRIFNLRNTSFWLALCWTISALLMVPAMLDLVQYGYMAPIFSFTYNPEKASSRLFSLYSAIESVITVIVMIVLYSAIVWKIRSTRVRLNVSSVKENAGVASRKEIRLAMQFLIISAMFVVTNIFFFISIGLQKRDGITLTLIILENLFFAVIYTIEPYIYLVFNHSMRRELVRLCGCMKAAAMSEDSAATGSAATTSGTRTTHM